MRFRPSFHLSLLEPVNTKRLFFALACLWAIYGPWLFILNKTGLLNVNTKLLSLIINHKTEC